MKPLPSPLSGSAATSVDRWRRNFDEVAAWNRDVWVSEQADRIPRGARVLDIGAGPCRYRSLFQHCEYRAQDFAAHTGSTEGPLADAGKWGYGELDYICDATEIPVPDASFDAVLCTEVLEHVPDPPAVIREAARVLKPGGRLIATAPLGSGLHQEPFHFFGGFTPYWYERVLGACSFEQVTVTPNGGFFLNYAQESRRFSAWIDPRRLPLAPAVLMFPVWLLTLPWCRGVLPLLCRWLDRFDTHKGFTVGYHITAVRGLPRAKSMAS